MKKFLIIALSFAFANVSYAVDSSVSNKVDRIERRMIALEKQVFSGKSPINTVSADNKLLAKMQARMQQMEEQNAKLYGKVEELGYAVEKLTEQLKVISEDFDYRIGDLEKNSMSNNSQGVNKESKTNNVSALKASSSSSSAKVEVPKSLSAEKVYEKAYSYLTLTEYDKSAQWFSAFIERFPQHKLTDNAYYWLGEIHLVQGDVKGAILSFSKGLKNFPAGRKAPANLLKIGVAFEQMGNNKHAKNSWEKLIKDFPNTPEAEKAKNFLEKL